MRNYPPFPKATPHRPADCPRVPHPSATPRPEGRTSDLHALGTPPALILSQDQTLHQFCLCFVASAPRRVAARAASAWFTRPRRHPPSPARPSVRSLTSSSTAQQKTSPHP